MSKHRSTHKGQTLAQGQPNQAGAPARVPIDDRFMRQQPCIGSGPMVAAGEVVRMVCSNEACPYNQYVPLITFQQFEDYVLMALKKSPRARGWTHDQCRMNLWTKKGYELVYRACGCNCGKGFVRRDMQYLEPLVLMGDGSPPQPKVAQQQQQMPRKMSAEMSLPQPKPGVSGTTPLAQANGVRSNGYGSNDLHSEVPVAPVLPIDDDSSEEEGICPLCMEEMDTTDQTFLPCPCEYQMCLYCFNHVKENLNGQCPACRTPYDTNNYRFKPEPVPKKNKEKKDPAVKEAEMAAQAQAVARQQAQARADMIARAQQAQAAARQGSQNSQSANRPDMQARAQAHQARVAAQHNQEVNTGSWAAITSNDSEAAVLPPPPNSQAWPSLGGSSAPVERHQSQDSGWGSNAVGVDAGEVEDWEQLVGEETGGVPGLDDAKKDAEVAALLRQVSELQRKLQEAEAQVAQEREAREEATQKCITIRTLQVAFDQELMTMATKWQLDSQQENERAMGGIDNTSIHDMSSAVAPLTAVAPPSVPSWPTESLPTQGMHSWGGSGYSAFGNDFGGIAASDFGISGNDFGGGMSQPQSTNQVPPGLTSIFGTALGGGALGGGAGSVWGTSSGVAQTSNQSPWGASLGGGSSSIW